MFIMGAGQLLSVRVRLCQYLGAIEDADGVNPLVSHGGAVALRVCTDIRS